MAADLVEVRKLLGVSLDTLRVYQEEALKQAEVRKREVAELTTEKLYLEGALPELREKVGTLKVERDKVQAQLIEAQKAFAALRALVA